MESDDDIELDDNDPRVTGILPISRRRQPASTSEMPFVTALADLQVSEKSQKGKKRGKRHDQHVAGALVLADLFLWDLY